MSKERDFRNGLNIPKQRLCLEQSLCPASVLIGSFLDVHRVWHMAGVVVLLS